jgi:hypothetical protein
MTNISTFQGGVFIPEYIKHSGDDNNLFGFSGTDTFKITTAGTDRLTVNSSGNVGVGLTNPSTKLHIGSGDVGIDRDQKFDFGAGYNSNWYITQKMADNKIYFERSGGGGNELVIDTSGNVGVGTASPSEKFHVHENISTSGHQIIARVGGSTSSYNTLVFGSKEGRPHIGGHRGDYGAWHDLSLQNDVMVIQQGGKVGIGRTDPYFPLHIQGTGVNATQNPEQWWAWVTNPNFNANYRSQNLNTSSAGVGITATGLYSHSSIGCNAYLYSHGGGLTGSDTRIKCEIVDVEDGEALNMLRLLKPKQYNYKDAYNRGTDPVWGFIAQEVAETIPYATKLIQEYIPNIYQLGNVSNSNVITFTNFNTSNLESNVSLIRLKDLHDVDHEVTVANIINENSIQVIQDLSEWTDAYDETGNVVSGNQIFVFGQRIDDFHFLKKDSIWTVATAALQEVDRQLQAERVKVATLETQLASVLTRLDALESA